MDFSAEIQSDLSVSNIAFYRFTQLRGLQARRQIFLSICNHLGLRGSIIFSGEGINGMLAGRKHSIRQFQLFLDLDPQLAQMNYQESYSSQVPFQELLIKIKKEIIPIGNENIQPEKTTAPRISPKELKRWLDEKREFILLDTRNQYEIEYGTFEKSQHLGLRHFRNIQEKLKKSALESQKEKPLVMFCTGGIRCEKASVVALNEGFRDVYQLEGGILKYFKECGGSHYKGNCFVFDERVALDAKLNPISKS